MNLGPMRRLRHLPPTHTNALPLPRHVKAQALFCTVGWVGWLTSRLVGLCCYGGTPQRLDITCKYVITPPLDARDNVPRARTLTRLCYRVVGVAVCVFFARCYCCAFSVDDKGAVKTLAAPRVRPLALPAR